IGGNRGVLGIFDMMNLRDDCTHERYWEIHRSLLWHILSGDGQINVSDDAFLAVDDLEKAMKETTLQCFRIFKEQYIDHSKNLFEEIAQIKIREMIGDKASTNTEWFKSIQSEDGFSSLIEAIKS